MSTSTSSDSLKRKPFIIGIDCGVNTGVAIKETGANTFIYLKSLDFWQAYDLIIQSYPPESCRVHIEFLSEKEGLYSDRKVHGHRMAANVGGVRRETALLIKGLERLGYEVLKIRPTRIKWSQEDFTRHTGDTRRTNEHVRDAAWCVYNYR